MFVQDQTRAKLEEAVQKWQTSARKAQRYADACYAEAQAKTDEAAEATAQVPTHQMCHNPAHMHVVWYTVTEADS